MAYVLWQWVGFIVTHPRFWMVLCIGFVLLHTSGYMYNSIRNTPYVGSDGRGHISYIAGGFQSQFGMETQIIAALCKASPLQCCCFWPKMRPG